MSQRTWTPEWRKEETQPLLIDEEPDLSPSASKHPEHFNASAIAQSNRFCSSSSQTDDKTDIDLTHSDEPDRSFNDQVVDCINTGNTSYHQASFSTGHSEDIRPQMFDTIKLTSLNSSSTHRSSEAETNQTLDLHCQDALLDEERRKPVNARISSDTPVNRKIHYSDTDLESFSYSSTSLSSIGLACQAVTNDCFHGTI